MTNETIRPFQVHFPEADLVDLRRRLAATRLPEKETVADFSQGVPLKTIEQVLRLFENQNKDALYNGDHLVKQFADPLTQVQSQILQLLSIPTAGYGPGK